MARFGPRLGAGAPTFLALLRAAGGHLAGVRWRRCGVGWTDLFRQTAKTLAWARQRFEGYGPPESVFLLLAVTRHAAATAELAAEVLRPAPLTLGNRPLEPWRPPARSRSFGGQG